MASAKSNQYRATNNNTLRIVIFILIIIAIQHALPVAAQWRAAKLPAGYESGYYLDVFFLPSNPKYGWVSGMQGKVLRTTDGGATWRGAIVPTNGDMLESVQFVSSTIGYASGPGGIWKSVDGGVAWSDVTPPSATAISYWGCFFVSQNVGMLLGGYCGGEQYFFRTTDGGSTWSVFTGNQRNTKLSDVMLESANGVGYASSSGLIWRSSDGGKSWNVLSMTGTYVWQEEITHLGASILTPTSGSDCDGNDRNFGEMRFSTDEGATWRSYQTRHSMFGAFLNSPTSGWGVGDEAEVIHTIDAGKTWQLSNCGIPSKANIDDVWFINDTTGWCVGQGVYYYVPDNGIPVRVQAGQKTICAGDSVIISASEGFDRYLWSTGETKRQIMAGAGGTYRVTAYIDDICYITSDSIVIKSLPAPKPILQTNKLIPALCKPGDSIIISAQSGFVSYRWSTGDTTREITVKSEGEYFVNVIDSNGCAGVSQNIAVRRSEPYIPRILVDKKTTFCAGDSVTLSADAGYLEYLWSTGENTRGIKVKKAGVYTVTVRDVNGCYGVSDSIRIITLDLQNRLEFSNIAPDERELSLDSSVVGALKCGSIILRNRDSLETVIIRQPLLLHNILFSLKQSELPVAIPPLGVARLSICFAPADTGFARDTLIISDTCSPNIIPLRGYGKPALMRGESSCEIPVDAKIISLGDNYKASAPYPNPSSGEFAVSYEFRKNVELKSARLINSFGVEAGKITWKTEVAGSEGESGSIRVETIGLSAGAYIFVVTVDGKSIVMPVLLE